MSAHDHHDHDHPPSAKRVGGLSVVKTTAKATPEADRLFWRSIEERQGSADLEAASHREFPEGASELDGVSRRNFMGLLGASLALSGAACYRPNQKIVPFVRQSPEVTPGNPLFFATAFSLEGVASGLVVDSHSGRPTKVEGNPDHPETQGASHVFEQALVLGLYDETRARQITHAGRPAAWSSLLGHLAKRSETFDKNGGAGLRFLVEPSSSPLIGDLRTRILTRFPKAKFVSFSSVAPEGAAEGARLAFGRPLEARHDLSQAQVILSLDADFLGDGPEAVRLHRQFSDRRVPGDNMNRLYVAEPCPTVTGGMADHRLRLRGSEIITLTQAVVAELAKQPGMESLAPLAGLSRAQVDGRVDQRWAAAVAKDLARMAGRSLVMAGRRQPAFVHALANAMNVALGNVNKTITFRAPVRHDASYGVAALQELAGEIAAGQVDTLVITARNPVYGAPSDLKLDKLLGRVPERIYLGLHEDETALAITGEPGKGAGTFVPSAHGLESWGDARAVDGTVSLIQPLIAPLWSGTTEADLLAAFVGEGERGTHELLRQYWQKRSVVEGWSSPLGFESLWETWLAKGIIDRTAATIEMQPSFDARALAGSLGGLASSAVSGGGIEVAFAVDPKVHDGRFANNVWLQELPHPITKITWDNAVLISETTARELGVKTSDVVRIELGDRAVSGPVYVQPGHADNAITLSLGYGRQGAESYGRGVGFNAGVLRTSANPWFVRGASLTKTARGYKFGITQDHGRMEDRDPAMSATLAQFLKEDSKINEVLEMRRHKLPVMHEPVQYDAQPYKWAMAIDLSKCSGCNACVIACQSENNIPVVGRDNVRIGREMHWIRLDRYYSGPVEDPEIIHQPSACVHCETAPCEYVCPVNATVHSDEGLNEMVYNRCIGTRYCSNNCPYKARRFNFLDYHGEVPATKQMAANPDVTVRSRGIMEKCTYCVQRIERVRIDSRIEGRKIADGELKTACQQTCPADAIVFGSLNDPNSQVSKAHRDPRRYNVLHELGTRPRTAYLARIRNPNPELA